MKKSLWFLPLLIIFSMVFTACGGSAVSATETPRPSATSTEDVEPTATRASTKAPAKTATLPPTPEEATEAAVTQSESANPGLACMHTNLHWAGYSQEERFSFVDYLGAANITSLRMDLTQKRYDELKGFGSWDDLFARANEKGITEVFATLGQWGGRNELWNDDHNIIYQNPDDYYEWVKRVVDHYQRLSKDPSSPLYGMKFTWIMGNEANEDGFMEVAEDEFDATVERYLPLLKAGAQGAKDADPEAYVSTGPLSPDAGQNWYEAIYDAIAEDPDLYDGFAINWYIPGEDPSADNMAFMEDIKASIGDKDFLVLEFGWEDAQEIQAERIQAAIELARSPRFSKILRAFCVHYLIDTDEKFGVFHYDRDTKEVCATEAYWAIRAIFNPKGNKPDVQACA